jgi:hypothetical protein
MLENVHPIEMGYHVAVGGENHVREWHSLGQSNVKSWFCLVGSVVGVNS